MGLNEPKGTQKTLNISKNDSIWAQNGPKWAQMSKPINELKRALMSSNFNKILTSDAYQCKTWYILQFSSGVINVKNKKNYLFCTPFS